MTDTDTRGGTIKPAFQPITLETDPMTELNLGPADHHDDADLADLTDLDRSRVAEARAAEDAEAAEAAAAQDDPDQ